MQRGKFNRLLNVSYRRDIHNTPWYSSLEADVGWRVNVSEGITLLDRRRIDDGFPIDELSSVGDTGTETTIVPVILDRRACSRVKAGVTDEAYSRERAWVS